MIRYVILLAGPSGAWEQATDEQRRTWMRAHADFEARIREHGRIVGGAALVDAGSATTVRHDEDGGLIVTDGPFAESTEQIGGLYHVEVPDLDAAIAAVRLLPSYYSVEIRPEDDLAGLDGS